MKLAHMFDRPSVSCFQVSFRTIVSGSRLLESVKLGGISSSKSAVFVRLCWVYEILCFTDLIRSLGVFRLGQFKIKQTVFVMAQLQTLILSGS